MDMVAQDFNANTQEAETTDLCEFQVSQDFIVRHCF